MPYLTTRKNLKLQLSPGLVASYDIQPGNGVGLFWYTAHTLLWWWWWWWHSGVEGQVVDEISRLSQWKRSTHRQRSTIATRPRHRHTATTSSRRPHPLINFRSDQVHTNRFPVRLSWYLATTPARHPRWRTVPSATTCWYPKPEAVSSEVTWPTNMTSLGDGR